jgi:hypothetical protein
MLRCAQHDERYVILNEQSERHMHRTAFGAVQAVQCR